MKKVDTHTFCECLLSSYQVQCFIQTQVLFIAFLLLPFCYFSTKYAKFFLVEILQFSPKVGVKTLEYRQKLDRSGLSVYTMQSFSVGNKSYKSVLTPFR